MIRALTAAFWLIRSLFITTPAPPPTLPAAHAHASPHTPPLHAPAPDTTDDAITSRLKDSKTYRAYANARACFFGMCDSLGLNRIPVSPNDAETLLLNFVLHTESLSLRPKTLKTYVSGIRHHWNVSTGTDLSHNNKRISLLIRDFTSRCTLPPLYREAFRAQWISHTLHLDPVVPLALSIGFFFFLRVSEYATTANTGCRLQQRHLATTNDAITLTVAVSKTDTVHRGSQHSRLPLDSPICPTRLYKAYLDGLPPAPPDAPALRWRSGAPLTDADVNRICKTAATAAGISDDAVALISSHSLRVGGATAAHAAGISDEWILREGRWESISSLRTYIRFDHHLTQDMGSAMLAASASTPLTTRNR